MELNVKEYSLRKKKIELESEMFWCHQNILQQNQSTATEINTISLKV